MSISGIWRISTVPGESVPWYSTRRICENQLPVLSCFQSGYAMQLPVIKSRSYGQNSEVSKKDSIILAVQICDSESSLLLLRAMLLQ